MANRPFTKLACIGVEEDPPFHPTGTTTDRPGKLGLLIRGLGHAPTGAALVAFLKKAVSLATTPKQILLSQETIRLKGALEAGIAHPADLGILSMTATYPAGRPGAPSAYDRSIKVASMAVAAASGEIVRVNVLNQAVSEIPADLARSAHRVAEKIPETASVGLGIAAVALLAGYVLAKR